MAHLVNNRIFNIINLGICVTILYAAFFTMGTIQKTLFASIASDVPNFTGSSNFSHCLLYFGCIAFVWFAPSLISLMGNRGAMMLGALGYSISIASFCFEKAWIIYAASFINGMGTALLWPALANYLVLNSDVNYLTRDWAILWAFYHAAFLFGNIFVLTELESILYMDQYMRRMIISTLVTLSVVANILLMSITAPNDKLGEPVMQEHDGPKYALKKMWYIFTKKSIFMLSLTFAHIGLQWSFFGSILNSRISALLYFKFTDSYIFALAGVYLGIGEIMGCLCQIVLHRRISKSSSGRILTIAVATAIQLSMYAVTYINLSQSTHGKGTENLPTVLLGTLFSATLLGIVDSCFNTQVYSVLNIIFPDFSTQTTAAFKFIKSVFMLFGYYFISQMKLPLHIGLCAVICLMAAYAFFIVHKDIANKPQEITGIITIQQHVRLPNSPNDEKSNGMVMINDEKE